MTPKVFSSTREVEEMVGRALGTSDWIMVTQDRVDRFAAVTDDHQWIHVDIDRAAASPFGGTIVHGYLTLSLLPAFSRQLFTFNVGSARLNYGLERVRFPSPLRVGAKIHATPTVSAVRHVAAGTQVNVTWIIEAQGVARPVCVAESITLVVP